MKPGLLPHTQQENIFFDRAAHVITHCKVCEARPKAATPLIGANGGTKINPYLYLFCSYVKQFRGILKTAGEVAVRMLPIVH